MLCANHTRMACRRRKDERKALPGLGGACARDKIEGIKKNLDMIGTSAYTREYSQSAGKNQIMTIKHANLPGYPNMPLNIWGKATLLLDLLYRDRRLPKCDIYSVGDDGVGEYEVNGIRVGSTEEQVTTCIWLMVESYAAEGHISFQDNPAVAEAALDAAAA